MLHSLSNPMLMQLRMAQAPGPLTPMWEIWKRLGPGFGDFSHCSHFSSELTDERSFSLFFFLSLSFPVSPFLSITLSNKYIFQLKMKSQNAVQCFPANADYRCSKLLSHHVIGLAAQPQFSCFPALCFSKMSFLNNHRTCDAGK